MMQRRDFLRASGVVLGTQAALRAADAGAIAVDPKPLFDLSPWLYMQFMEPLGATDSAVEACWDYDTDDWRKDFVDTVRDLAPGAMRFGGLFSRYYRWREGIGAPVQRPWMRNYVWGGKETNRAGTHEFVDLCRRVGAEPFYCVNFLSDGEKRYRGMKEGDRTADAREAADWVSYANDPDHRERKANGAAAPLNLKLWQIGNETSYGNATFTRDEAIANTIEFARAMKQRDPSIHLIAWGDRGREGLWAPEMLRRAGEHIDTVAMHMMGQSPKRSDTVLKGLRYQEEPEQAWGELLELAGAVERRLTEFEQAVAAGSSRAGIAITEGHLSLSPHNANPILCEWLSAAYHARSFNIYQRHGARVKIATVADFPGTRWTVASVMVPVPRGRSYLLPAGAIARLFRRHNGTQGIVVQNAPEGLDIAASRTGNKVWLHVANLRYRGGVEATFAVDGMRVAGGRVFEIAPENLRTYANQDQPDAFQPREAPLPADGKWRFPAGSVSAVELDLAN